MLAVAYRFVLAALVAFAVCAYLRLPLTIAPKHHGFLVLQGILVFGINYWLIYISESQLTSGLVAVIFSTMVIMNMINSRIIFKTKIAGIAVIGALLGLIGVACLFWPEVKVLTFRDANFGAILLSLLATLIASLGNMVMARNQLHGLPALQVNAYGMFYGSMMLVIIALVRGVTFNWGTSLGFNVSLLYLSVFGSMVAFWSYTSLIREIGVDKAGYSSLLIPAVALGLSTLVENYQWNVPGIIGFALIIAGNFLVMRRPKLLPA